LHGATNDAPAQFAMVLGFRASEPRVPRADVVAALGRHLLETQVQEAGAVDGDAPPA
jgi:hypothetical protein